MSKNLSIPTRSATSSVLTPSDDNTTIKATRHPEGTPAVPRQTIQDNMTAAIEREKSKHAVHKESMYNDAIVTKRVVPAIFIVIPMGITKRMREGSIPNFLSKVSIATGKVTAEELEENAKSNGSILFFKKEKGFCFKTIVMTANAAVIYITTPVPNIERKRVIFFIESTLNFKNVSRTMKKTPNGNAKINTRTILNKTVDKNSAPCITRSWRSKNSFFKVKAVQIPKKEKKTIKPIISRSAKALKIFLGNSLRKSVKIGLEGLVTAKLLS